ncbi:MAG: cation diffusion facilitator family transporter [Terriglobales bacterium]
MAHLGHADAHNPGRVLRISLLVTLAYIVLLVITGLRARSLALLSEAGHNVSDFLALGLSLLAVYLQSRPPTTTKTYGYDRAGVIAAFINSVTLVAFAFYVFYEAAERLYSPVAVQPKLMIGVAAGGVVMNAAIAALVWRSSREDVNLRSVLLHEIGDTLSTAAVIVGGWGILVTGQQWIDPALSFGIGALILWSAFGIIRETLNILLEGTPAGLEMQHIRRQLESVGGVNGVHDLHVWSIGSNTHALSCHIAIADIPLSETQAILRSVQRMLREQFSIYHTTIQFEHAECDAANGCIISVPDAHPRNNLHNHRQ